jgi:hydroxymethylglutaryl-CoA lyase
MGINFQKEILNSYYSLQNERKMVPTDKKVELINRLSDTGISVIEPGAFVSPKWIPQMADSDQVFKRINKKEGVQYPVLIPNKAGLEKAIEVGAKQASIFVSASETFSKQNINCTITESIKR